MAALPRYDGSFQMFVEPPRELDPNHLRFMRWLAERGRLEHGVAGSPDGSYTAPRDDDIDTCCTGFVPRDWLERLLGH